MSDQNTRGRPGPPVAGDEAATLLGSLDRQRAIFAWKCGGLDAAGLRATAAASSMTLGGLLKHLALVEDEYFSRRLLGRDLGPPWDAVDWDADRDWEWHSAAADSPEQLYALWREAVARSRSAVGEALADGGLGQLARWASPRGRVTQPAAHPDRHHRGVRAARRPCRPHPGVRSTGSPGRIRRTDCPSGPPVAPPPPRAEAGMAAVVLWLTIPDQGERGWIS